MPDPTTPDESTSTPSGVEVFYVESLVKSKDKKPAVGFRWGDLSCQLTPEEAREHALGIIEAAIAAELDSAVVEWAMDRLGQPPENAGKLLHHIRGVRESPEGIPSCTLNMGTESIRPATARVRGLYLIANAANTEMEASLALILMRDMGLDSEAVAALIQELRDVRGLSTDWQQAGMGDGPE
jgi:hypothetical protein